MGREMSTWPTRRAVKTGILGSLLFLGLACVGLGARRAVVPSRSLPTFGAPSRLRSALMRIFDDDVMRFLALVAFATALGPLVFDVSPVIEHELAVFEWLLVAAFAAEFVLQGLRAPDRRIWLGSYWRTSVRPPTTGTTCVSGRANWRTKRPGAAAARS